MSQDAEKSKTWFYTDEKEMGILGRARLSTSRAPALGTEAPLDLLQQRKVQTLA